MNFQGKTALVTGSTAGIGAATAKLLAQHGADVIVSGRSAERGQAVVDGIVSSGGSARFVAADLADIASVRQLADAVGVVDVLINNAGVAPMAPTVDQTLDVYEETFAINVRAPFFLTAALAPAMVERGSGSIVNISTMVAQVGLAGLAAYSASKAAVNSLTRTWTAEFAASGVRINTVAPGPTATEASASMGEDVIAYIAGTTALGRMATPEEIASVIAFVASDDAAYLTGATIAADGGRTAI